ncbi:MAG TPA: hypothetical protein PLA50_20140, partial [Bacteroidia bacterium]|nr:hypothetical protein [Bacteroidia bacterium]
ELKLDEASGERRGEIELKNSGSKALVLEARSSTRLQSHLRQEYVVAPEKTTKVQVKLGATDTAPFDGSVEFFLKNGYAKPVRVFAPVVPGRLEVKVPGSITTEVINFGAVEAGRSVERGIVVTNRGGVAMPLEFHVPEPFRLLTNPGPQLAPLTSVDLSIGLQPATTSRGAVDVTMNVRGVDHSLPIRLMGNVVAPSGAPPAATVGGAPATNLPMKGVRIGVGKGGSSSDPEPSTAPADAPVAVARPASPPQGTSADQWKESLTPAQLVENRSPLGFVSRPIVERNTDLTLRRPEDLTVLETAS